MNTHRALSRILALTLSFMLVFSAMPVTVFAEGDDNCTHVHDALCGFVEGAPCGHEHDAGCGYAEAILGISCDKGCEGEVHIEGCAYVAAEPAVPCTHVHDADCGHVEAALCTHEHDEICGELAPLLGSSGETDAECICESLCAEGSVNADCPVCAEDFTLCKYEVSTDAENTETVISIKGFVSLVQTASIYTDADAPKTQDGLLLPGTLTATVAAEGETENVEVPVTWTGDKPYTGEPGEYIFTAAVIGEGYALAEGVTAPAITVTVGGEAAPTVTITEFAPLDPASLDLFRNPDNHGNM
jgi:hypothetical protein